MQKRNSNDFLLSTPQWSAFSAYEKGTKKKQLPDFVVDKREIVTDPESGKKFYRCRMVSESEIYQEVKNLIL
jgi:hypothetical protein